MATLIELELEGNRGKVLVNPEHIVSVTEEIALETGNPTTRVVLNIYSQVAQATGNAPFILVEETPAQVQSKMSPVVTPPTPTPTVVAPTVDPTKPQGGIGQVVLWTLPIGKIVSDLFNSTGFGTDPIVSGWAICNGQNNTIDLRGRVPLGWNPDDTEFNILGKEGGAKTHKLTINEMPKHSHNYRYSYVGNTPGLWHPNNPESFAAGLDNPTVVNTTIPNSTAQAIHASGGDGEHNNLQPYKVVLFIQRIS